MIYRFLKKTFFLFIFIFPNFLEAQLEVTHLKCEYLKNPIGLEVQHPRLSWQIKTAAEDRDVLQSAFQIQVSSDSKNWKKSLIWDSKKINTNQSIHNLYQGKQLTSGQRVFWRVKIWDNKNRESEWSEIAFWEMGLLQKSDWIAKWIEPNLKENPKANNPSPMLRKDFFLKTDSKKNIKKARLYITAHGLYEASINGKKISDHLFTPGWTSYSTRLQYQVYDVTDWLAKGDNAIGVRLGDGWYRGEFGWRNNRNIYGENLGLLFQLKIEFSDGSSQQIISDESWKCSTGAIRMSSIYDGEIYDARLEQVGWNLPNFDDKKWSSVRVATHSNNNLIPSISEPIRFAETLTPIALITTPKGERVLDFGQNLVGWISFSMDCQSGDTMTIIHAEVLDKEGNFYRENLRHADQKIQYVCKGNEQENFEPHFTFQGFRYAKLEGFPKEIRLDDFAAKVIHTDMESTGFFECSDTMINQLQSNIRWGQKGNFLDIPTDCPQRDERMGWTGDAQVFAPTACFNFQTAPFFTKWLADLEADQRDDGAVPWIVPNFFNKTRYGSAGWGDAAVIVPWTIYQKYGDRQILEQQFSSMQRWVDFMYELAGDDFIIQEGFHFGDWMFFIHPHQENEKPGHTDKDLIATAFMAYSTLIFEKTCFVLEKKDLAKKYRALREKVLDAFRYEFVTASGRLTSNSQTAYLLALSFDLLTEQQKPTAVNYLLDNLEKRKYHLSTGFLGTPHLCPTLSKYGHLDVAYKLLLRKKYPSWLYPITKGATTIWERWDGIKPDGSFQAVKVNSFNHYAYGAIGDWLYSTVAGIQHDEARPGYQHFKIAPQPGGGLTFATAELDSMYGKIISHWKISNNKITIQVTVPPNTTAEIILPQKNEKMKVGSGSYEFSYPFEN